MVIFDALDDGVVTEVIRPAAVVPESAARQVLVEMALRDVRSGGHWYATPALWRRYDQSWSSEEPGTAKLLGSLQIAYGTPTRYDITIYRVTITREGTAQGYDVTSLTDEALAFGGLTLGSCPRVALTPPPPRFTHR